MSDLQQPVFKQCNVNAAGCHRKWNMTARAQRERIAEQKKSGIARYKSRYDACDNPACQKQ